MSCIPNYYLSVRTKCWQHERLDEINFRETPLRIGWGSVFGVTTRIAPVQAAIMGEQAESHHDYVLRRDSV